MFSFALALFLTSASDIDAMSRKILREHFTSNANSMSLLYFLKFEGFTCV